MAVVRGPVAVLSPRQAAMLLTYADLQRLRARYRSSGDPELGEMLRDLEIVANVYLDGCADVTRSDAASDSAASSELMSPKQAAEHLDITPAAVRRAIDENRLRATKVDGRWQISRADLEAYSPRATANTGSPAGLAVKHLLQARAEDVGIDQLVEEMTDAGLRFALVDEDLAETHSVSEIGLIAVHAPSTHTAAAPGITGLAAPSLPDAGSAA